MGRAYSMDLAACRGGGGARRISTAAAASRRNGASQEPLRAAVWQIIIADVSMSLDNVLAVAGAAREHPVILVFGLALSIALMATTARSGVRPRRKLSHKKRR